MLGCSEHRLPLWRDAAVIGQRLRAVPFGRDVAIDVAHFSMVGRASRNLRRDMRLPVGSAWDAQLTTPNPCVNSVLAKPRPQPLDAASRAPRVDKFLAGAE